MLRKLQFLITTGLLLALSTGCAVGVKQQAFHNDVSAPVRSIAVVTVPEPALVSVHNWGSAAGGFGAASSQSKYKEPMASMLARANFEFSREMRDAIVERLQLAGYQVTTLDYVRDEPTQLIADYGRLPATRADAILDIATHAYFGYANVSILDSKFRPNITLSARLVSNQTKQPLFAEEFMYGWTNLFLSSTELPAPEKYFYAEADAIISNHSNSVAGLRDGIAAIADHLALRLQP